MLAKANRVVAAADFKAAVRRGKRVPTPNTVIYCRPTNPGEPTRFGFIVAKTVGNAVVRNRMRRRFRSIGRQLLASTGWGTDVVVRALPGSSMVSWASLLGEISVGVQKGVNR